MGKLSLVTTAILSLSMMACQGQLKSAVADRLSLEDSSINTSAYLNQSGVVEGASNISASNSSASGDAMVAYSYGFPKFQDVNWDASGFSEIATLAIFGITRGCQAYPPLYCPDNFLTRGQASTFVIRTLFGETFDFPSSPYFDDVPSDHPFFKYIQKMKELKLTSGCSASRFCPDDSLTHGQLAVFLARAKLGIEASADVSKLSYLYVMEDVPTTHPFYAHVQNFLSNVVPDLGKQVLKIDEGGFQFGVDEKVDRRLAAIWIAHGFHRDTVQKIENARHVDIIFDVNSQTVVNSHDDYYNIKGAALLSSSLFSDSELFVERINYDIAKKCQALFYQAINSGKRVRIAGSGVIMIGKTKTSELRRETVWEIFDPTIGADKSLRAMIDIAQAEKCEILD